MTERYDFPNDKFTKLLRFFSVVEAYVLICPRHFGRKFQFCFLFLEQNYACTCMDLSWSSIQLVCQFLLLRRWELKLDCIEEVHMQDQGRKVTVVLKLTPGCLLEGLGPSACFEMDQLS